MVEEIGQNAFIRKWFNSEIPDSLIAPLEESAQTQFSIIADQLLSRKESFINITHDWNIMILREYYLGLKHEEIGQPEYLDGLYAYLNAESIILSSMNVQKSIPLDSLTLSRNQ
jgi:hypothetical protein